MSRSPVDVLVARDLRQVYKISRGFLKPAEHLQSVGGVSFTLQAGKTLAVVGESGCGKSTLARMVSLIEKPAAGELRLNGVNVMTAAREARYALRRTVQLVFQNPFGSLNPRKKIGAILEAPLEINTDLSAAECAAQARAMLALVGLRPEHYERYPHMFSGGQRQRIAIARALMLKPSLIVADEPVSALDVSIQAQIINLMLDLQRELGIAFLFISHDMAVVERVSHRVAVMYLGQIVEIGPRRAIFEDPQHAYTRRLMAAVPVADPARRHLRRELLEGEIPSPIRAVGDDPVVQPLQQVGADHFVARHRVGGLY